VASKVCQPSPTELVQIEASKRFNQLPEARAVSLLPPWFSVGSFSVGALRMAPTVEPMMFIEKLREKLLGGGFGRGVVGRLISFPATGIVSNMSHCAYNGGY
jgi:hypothetical protein